MTEFEHELVVAPPALLDEWDLWMTSAGRSTRTRTERLRTASRFIATADPLTCTWQPIAAWLACFPDRSTKATYGAHLRALFKWLVLTDQRLDDPTTRLPTVHAPRGVPRPLTPEQLARVLGGRMRHRTRAMIALAAFQGMRVSEIASHRGESLRDGRLRIPNGKGGTDVTLAAHPYVLEVADRLPDIGWWFPSTKPGQHVNRVTVSTTIREAMRRAGVDATAHQLRHTFGTTTLRTAGGNLRVAQQALRHASIATTQIYTLVDNDEVTAAITALPVPLHLWRGHGGG